MPKKKSPAKKTSGKKKPSAAKGAKPARKKSAPKTPTLGRPKVTGDELLYMLFKEDYHARQVFEFLRVKTVKELELHSSADIIKRLSQPVRDTVERIRRTLAVHNRCLAGDLEYALDKKAEGHP